MPLVLIVLIVDNEGLVRNLLTDVLRGSGYEVSLARSGFEAIEMVTTLAPDLVMLEVNMPGLDGWRTMEQLQATQPDLRILMMSGSDVAREALSHGAAAFLEKPYRPSDVVREVERLIGPGTPPDSRNVA